MQGGSGLGLEQQYALGDSGNGNGDGGGNTDALDDSAALNSLPTLAVSWCFYVLYVSSCGAVVPG